MTTETIDMTPTFEQAVKMCIVLLKDGTPQGQREAEEELLRYGRELDRLKAAAEAAEELPEYCYALNPSNPRHVTIVKRGERGFWAYAELAADGARRMVDRLNKALGVSPAQREAMQAGSMFGWHVPGARPEHYPDAKPLTEGE